MESTFRQGIIYSLTALFTMGNFAYLLENFRRSTGF